MGVAGGGRVYPGCCLCAESAQIFGRILILPSITVAASRLVETDASGMKWAVNCLLIRIIAIETGSVPNQKMPSLSSKKSPKRDCGPTCLRVGWIVDKTDKHTVGGSKRLNPSTVPTNTRLLAVEEVDIPDVIAGQGSSSSSGSCVLSGLRPYSGRCENKPSSSVPPTVCPGGFSTMPVTPGPSTAAGIVAARQASPRPPPYVPTHKMPSGSFNSERTGVPIDVSSSGSYSYRKIPCPIEAIEPGGRANPDGA